MKQLYQSFFVTMFALWISTNLFAFDCEVDGIYYNRLSSDEFEVTHGDNKYTGDVVIPENFKDAEGLLKRLNEVIEIIVLEKERIEKSLEGMQQLKDSFVEQCVERCLDVRTELDKLTKLSEISVGEQMNWKVS